MEKEETTSRWDFEGHKISSMRDMMTEATRAWKSKKSEKFLRAYVNHLSEIYDNSRTSLEVAVSNIKGMARYYASNGNEMKAMREYLRIEDKVREDLITNAV